MEVKQSQLIVNPDEKERIQAVERNTKNKLKAPVGFYPIRLSTKGKLSVPEVLHFRNFNMNEIIDLSTVTDEEERMFILIKCMNNMVFEDIKCEDLHENELTEILMNIHFMFNSSEIGPYQYHIDNTIEDQELLEKKENIGKVSFTNKDLNTISIQDNFKEPITIKGKNKSFKFRLPRINDTLKAREYVLEKYKAEKEQFLDIEWRLKHNENQSIEKQLPIPDDDLKEYKEYSSKKAKDFLRVFESCLIIGNDKKDFDLNESLEVFDNNEVDLQMWIAYNSTTKNIKFGIDENVIFKDPKDSSKSLARRFLFQPFDFMPDMELQGNSEYTVSFGD